MADIDMLSLEEQNILLSVAEAEIGVAEPLAAPIADFPSERVNATVDRLIRYGLLSRGLTVLDDDRAIPFGLSAALTSRGAQAVVELWRQRLRQPAKALLSA